MTNDDVDQSESTESSESETGSSPTEQTAQDDDFPTGMLASPTRIRL